MAITATAQADQAQAPAKPRRTRTTKPKVESTPAPTTTEKKGRGRLGMPVIVPTGEKPEETEDTIVQIKDKQGAWTDYARTTRSQALATVAKGKLPGHRKTEPLRAVDWITKDEVKPPKARKLKFEAIAPFIKRARMQDPQRWTSKALYQHYGQFVRGGMSDQGAWDVGHSPRYAHIPPAAPDVPEPTGIVT
jgi:hypothetical protein